MICNECGAPIENKYATCQMCDYKEPHWGLKLAIVIGYIIGFSIEGLMM
jgi:hypothetical protein